MSLERFRQIAEEISGRVTLVKLIGLGEPSLHPDLPAIMEILKRRRIKVLIYTNGTLFERYSPEEIFAWNVDEVVVSIDGTDARSFERLRVGGDYETLCANLAAFHARRAQRRAASPRIEVRHVIMPNETPAMLQRFNRDWRARFADTVKHSFLGEPYDRPRQAAAQRPPCRDIRREMHVRYDGRVPLCSYSGHREWMGDLSRASVHDV